MTETKLREALAGIKWRSADKDNMEFAATINYSQMDAIRAALALPQDAGAVEGWKEAAIAWSVCTSIHREYAKKRDPFFSTRQSDFTEYEEHARSMLAASPSPPGQPPHDERIAIISRWSDKHFGRGPLGHREIAELLTELFKGEPTPKVGWKMVPTLEFQRLLDTARNVCEDGPGGTYVERLREAGQHFDKAMLTASPSPPEREPTPKVEGWPDAVERAELIRLAQDSRVSCEGIGLRVRRSVK